MNSKLLRLFSVLMYFRLKQNIEEWSFLFANNLNFLVSLHERASLLKPTNSKSGVVKNNVKKKKN